MDRDSGRSPVGSGHSAEPEPISVVSAVPASVPNAALEHFSHAPLSAVESRAQREEDNYRGKPSGLWVSVRGEDDWPSWCKGEQWGLGGLAYRHAVKLSPAARVLWIQGLEQFDWFAAEYRVAEPRYSRAEIDWPRVAESFDGIVIAPYLWERRFEDWYYGWDCASGCIWNADAIAALGPAIAAGSRRAKTPQAVECEASQSGGASGIAQTQSGDTPKDIGGKE